VSMNRYRLPSTVSPRHYRLVIEPDLETDLFTGSVSIDADVVEATDSIVLNAQDLTINSASLSVGDQHFDGLTAEIDEELERVSFALPSTVAPGPITLDFSFAGGFNEHLVGLYASTYKDDDGNTRKLVSTQFEATHARKCFPCWDEPEAKATFQLDLVIDPALNAVANAAEVSRTTVDGKLRISFAPTITMSTYLVAMVIGDLEFSKTVDVDGTPLRIVHVPGKGELTDLALETGAAALRYFADYFDIPYPSDKLDLVAIPDFLFGAMENVGCVTFREVLLLIDPDGATQAELQRLVDVINHEIAHMWFGNLVTMKWWNGLWLNEAFATFMELKATDVFRPEWERWTGFGLERSAAFDTDGLHATRAIEFEVESPDEAEAMFDVLTYEKGAAVVRMLEQYVGEEPFRAGIRRYMAENQHGNTETTDLWDAIEAETGEPVRQMMDTWIFQGGFPLISVTTDDDSVTFRQQRMLFGESDSNRWSVPISYRWAEPSESPHPDPDNTLADPTMGAVHTGRILLPSDAESISVPLPQNPSWFLANANAHGFFRVAYSADHLDRLTAVAHNALTPLERYTLVDDAQAAMLVGSMRASEFIDLIEALGAETDLAVWRRMVGGVHLLDRILTGEARERLAELAHDLVAPPLANLGLLASPDEDERRKQLRGVLFGAMGQLANDPDIQDTAKELVAAANDESVSIDPSLLSAAVTVVAAGGDEADFAHYVEAWRNAATPQDARRYLDALAEFPDHGLAKQVQQLVLDGEIGIAEAPYLLAKALLNRSTTDLTWEFITENWEYILDTFPSMSIPRMLEGILAMNQDGDAAKTEAFFADRPLPAGQKTLHQLLEKQQIRIAFRQREQERLAHLLLS